MSSDKLTEYFDNFLKQLKVTFQDSNTQTHLENLEKLSIEEKLLKCNEFTKLVSNNFELFVKNKIKLFSHKSKDTQEISESLLGKELSLKSLLNQQSQSISSVIWNYLHHIYLGVELNKSITDYNLQHIFGLLELLNKTPEVVLLTDEDKNKINILLKAVNSNTEENNTNEEEESKKTGDRIRNMIGIEDANEDTDALIGDIIASFDNIKKNNNNLNPLGSVLSISKKISEKYKDKIQNGNVELDKLMKALVKKVPGMDKMVDSMGGLEGLDKNINNMMGGLGVSLNKNKNKEKVIIDENFSTANIEVPKVDEMKGSGMKIGNILKMADQFGVLPGGKKQESESDSNGMPDLSTLLSGLTATMGDQ
jgi:hypothetical protein